MIWTTCSGSLWHRLERLYLVMSRAGSGLSREGTGAVGQGGVCRGHGAALLGQECNAMLSP
eukprot:1823380-Pleurochrysis_carterae.AAC.3